jgi:hypothetical protein
MTFLQPWLLIGLPLLAIPIIIHLVHLRRHQTIPWAAMRFLLAATQMASGLSKLKQYLILAMRTLAVAALVFFTARPLASGISGWLAGDSNQLSILIVDRSPSMQLRIGPAGETKQEVAMQRVSEWIETAGRQRVVCFTTGREKPIEYPTQESMIGDPRLQPCALSTNVPALLDKAREYVEQNGVARATIWVCSDFRESDWRSKDPGWSAVRDGFSRTSADVTFQLLDLTSTVANRSIHLTEAIQVTGEQGEELQLSFKVTSQSTDATAQTETVSVELEIGEARSVIPLELTGGTGEVKRYAVPLKASGVKTIDPNTQDGKMGWGAVRIPADANESDNVAYFAYEPKPPRKTLIVSDNPSQIEALSISSSIPTDPLMKCEVEQLTIEQLETVDWEQVALVIWHNQLPKDNAQKSLETFIESGGQVLFVPPENPNENEAFGLQWKGWRLLDATAGTVAAPKDEGTARGGRVEQWRNDSVLLGNTLSGSALPLGTLGVSRVCEVKGNMTDLASLQGNLPLLVRSDAMTEQARGSVYALCTSPSPTDSTLAKDGVALYVMVHRMLNAGILRVGNAKVWDVTPDHIPAIENATTLMSAEGIVSNQLGEHSGVFRTGRLIVAQNRLTSEDEPKGVNSESLGELFGTLRWYRIEAIETSSSLVQEIWRWFAFLMLIALLVEAVLCIPNRKQKPLTSPAFR